jgi:hypothetical protein
MADGLLPDAEVTGRVRIEFELGEGPRKWGRILDLSALEPGDLLLFRPIAPNTDSISQRITQAQLSAGLHIRHAQWTHAAVYLGDGQNVCEANFKSPGQKDGVAIRSVFDYCDGTSAIRARRPRNMTQEQRIRITIGALTNLGKGYSFDQIVGFAVDASKAGWLSQLKGVFGLQRGLRPPPQSFVCSTLYQDALTYASRGTSVRLGTLCTPAQLSASGDFENNDPPLSWLEIE